MKCKIPMNFWSRPVIKKMKTNGDRSNFFNVISSPALQDEKFFYRILRFLTLTMFGSE